ncbi:NepR family anti-sigma factor [Mycoplana ramosa]|uniref:NepR family anti-sigma factor n=1 Tax=Mycoplana ramosa TaxID=40837 RepID=A0ABW3YX48_MYCRA
MNKPAVSQSKRARNRAMLDTDSVVGRRLKSYYDAIEAEPLPQELLDLLEKLDEAERQAKTPR